MSTANTRQARSEALARLLEQYKGILEVFACPEGIFPDLDAEQVTLSAADIVLIRVALGREIAALEAQATENALEPL